MFLRISNEALLAEAIRKVRLRKVPLTNGSYQGSKVAKVIVLLRDWIDPKELTETCNRMIHAGTLLATASKGRYTPGATRSHDRTNGRLDRFHPDAQLTSPQQYFSESGTPLGTSRKNGRLRVHSQGKPFWAYGYRMFYLTEDGVPDAVPTNCVQL